MARIRGVFYGFMLLCIAQPGRAQEKDVIFSFGVIADVQYADADQWGKRDYRGSPKRLEKCVEIFNSHDLSFIIHAGDLIDRDYRSFDVPLRIFQAARAPVHYVVGNHEFSVPDSLKNNVRRRINNPGGYYSFVEKNVQFILVDAMDVSMQSAVKDTRAYRRAYTLQQDLKSRNANNAFEWNGAMGRKQLKWMKKRLREGERRGYKSLLFSHLPLLPENGLQLWNNREVLELLHSFPSVVAFISGHHHEGGYVKDNSIHHLTLKGLVEATEESACGVVDVYPDRLVLKGFGDQVGYMLEID